MEKVKQTKEKEMGTVTIICLFSYWGLGRNPRGLRLSFLKNRRLLQLEWIIINSIVIGIYIFQLLQLFYNQISNWS